MTEQVFAASYAQQALWLVRELSGEDSAFQLGVEVPLPPMPLTAPDIRAALQAVVDRHEPLRTRLLMAEDAVAQAVAPRLAVELPVEDVGGLPPDAQRRRFAELLAADVTTPLPLEHRPLWRARAVRFAAESWSLAFVGHHGILDAMSLLNLRDELAELLSAAAEDRAPKLPPLAIQYADYAAWQRQQIEAGPVGAHLAHHRSALAGLPAHHDLPTDRPRGGLRPLAEIGFTCGAAVTAGVRDLARRCAGTPFMVTVAALATLVGRRSGRTDVVLGTPVHGRGLPELAPLIGMFVNTLVLRVDLSGDPPFAELVRRARTVVLDALDHGDVPFDLLVAELAPVRDTRWHPLFQIGVNHLSEHGWDTAGSGRSGFRAVAGDEDAPTDTPARIDLNLDLLERDGDLVGLLEYDAGLFDAGTAQHLVDGFRTLLAAATAAPDLALSQLPLLDPAEAERQLLATRPELAPGASDPTAWLRSPEDRVRSAARSSDGTTVTGDELAARASALARALRHRGVGPQAVVALAMPVGTVDWMVAAYAVLVAGGTVLPLDPAAPLPRRTFTVRDARPVLALIDDPAGPELAEVPTLDIAEASDASADLAPSVPPDTAALLAYTDGPGLPHGLVLSRAGLAAAAAGLSAVLRPEPGQSWSLATVHAPTFLGLATAMLASGADVHLGVPGRDVVAVGPTTTVACHPLAAGPPTAAAGVLLASVDGCGGPVLRWLSDGCRLRPLPHVGTAVLDSAGAVVPDGVVGELGLTGPAVARGVLGRPGPSAARFGPDPGALGGRLVRTGLSVRRRTGGSLEPVPPS